jgi:hypothetical protein
LPMSSTGPNMDTASAIYGKRPAKPS